ncbi:hypothetical protein A2U01_0100548, partial [Trifolium medium]|nr:hypothetical protein [Trifolium medium]
CHVIYAIMRGEPIEIGEMIARYIGHPFVITTLCQLEDVPTWEDTDEIAPAERPLDRTFFQRAVRDLQAAQAAAAAP